MEEKNQDKRIKKVKIKRLRRGYSENKRVVGLLYDATLKKQVGYVVAIERAIKNGSIFILMPYTEQKVIKDISNGEKYLNVDVERGTNGYRLINKECDMSKLARFRTRGNNLICLDRKKLYIFAKLVYDDTQKESDFIVTDYSKNAVATAGIQNNLGPFSYAVNALTYDSSYLVNIVKKAQYQFVNAHIVHRDNSVFIAPNKTAFPEVSVWVEKDDAVNSQVAVKPRLLNSDKVKANNQGNDSQNVVASKVELNLLSNVNKFSYAHKCFLDKLKHELCFVKDICVFGSYHYAFLYSAFYHKSCIRSIYIGYEYDNCNRVLKKLPCVPNCLKELGIFSAGRLNKGYPIEYKPVDNAANYISQKRAISALLKLKNSRNVIYEEFIPWAISQNYLDDKYIKDEDSLLKFSKYVVAIRANIDKLVNIFREFYKTNGFNKFITDNDDKYISTRWHIYFDCLFLHSILKHDNLVKSGEVAYCTDEGKNKESIEYLVSILRCFNFFNSDRISDVEKYLSAIFIHSNNLEVFRGITLFLYEEFCRNIFLLNVKTYDTSGSKLFLINELPLMLLKAIINNDKNSVVVAQNNLNSYLKEIGTISDERIIFMINCLNNFEFYSKLRDDNFNFLCDGIAPSMNSDIADKSKWSFIAFLHDFCIYSNRYFLSEGDNIVRDVNVYKYFSQKKEYFNITSDNYISISEIVIELYKEATENIKNTYVNVTRINFSDGFCNKLENVYNKVKSYKACSEKEKQLISKIIKLYNLVNSNERVKCAEFKDVISDGTRTTASWWYDAIFGRDSDRVIHDVFSNAAKELSPYMYVARIADYKGETISVVAALELYLIVKCTIWCKKNNIDETSEFFKSNCYKNAVQDIRNFLNYRVENN